MNSKITTLCFTVAMLATTAATPALSQSKNFAGPSISLSGAFVAGDVKVTADDGTNNSSANLGKSSIIPGVDLSYGIPLDNNFLLNLGATYDFRTATVGKSSANLAEVVDDGEIINTFTEKVTIKDHFSLYIQPTYAFSSSSAVFGKLSYNFAKGSLTETGTNLTPTSFTVSRNIKGFGYGVGLKSLLSNNSYFQVEAGIDEYDKGTGTNTDEGITYTFEPKVVTGKISIGYKF
jgi:hypothetical protein